MYKKTSSQASCLLKWRKELEDLPGSWLFLSYKKLSIFFSLLSDSFYSVCFVQSDDLWKPVLPLVYTCPGADAEMLELRKIHASSIRKARQWHCDYSFCKRKDGKKKNNTIARLLSPSLVKLVFDRKVSTRNCKTSDHRTSSCWCASPSTVGGNSREKADARAAK
jgi:hypothetical protein